jgi:hypothetical protein
MRDIGKVYKKMMCAPSEYQAFALYERLNDDEQRQLEELCMANGKMFFFFRHIHYSTLKEEIS